MTELNKRNGESWKQIENMIRFKLDTIERRQKEIESYMLRTVSDITKPKE